MTTVSTFKSLKWRRVVLFCAGFSAFAIASSAAPARPAPSLPPPSGTIVNVSTVAQLQAAFSSLASNETIVIAPGTYVLTSTLYINGTYSNLTVRGATDNSDDVVLKGPGMKNGSYGNVPYGIWTGGNVRNLTLANLTVRDVYYHPVILNAGTYAPRLYNLHLINAGQQFVKGNPDPQGVGVPDGIMEYSILEYETTSRDDYTNGIDIHGGSNWIVRNNLFHNIKAPSGLLAGPAVLMWNNSSGATIDGNTFVDCQREISMGLMDRGTPDNTAGIVRNNFVYRSSGILGDAGVLVADSANTVVVNNTLLLSGTYPNAVEYRFSETTGTLIANNLTDAKILARDGATGTVTNNVTTATGALFVSPATGDLHLKSTATVAIDKAPANANCRMDWDGQPRPQGAASDIGADEYGSTTSAPKPPTNVRIIR
jgi:hypothetical protein